MAEPLVQRTKPQEHGPRLARVYCIIGAPWNPIDHLANLWDREIAVEKVPLLTVDGEVHEGQPVGTFVVDHWRFADFIDAEAAPPVGGDVNVVVYHADVDPESRVCQACGATVGG